MIIAPPEPETSDKTSAQNFRTTHKRRELFNDRWTMPGGNSGISEVSDLLSPRE